MSAACGGRQPGQVCDARRSSCTAQTRGGEEKGAGRLGCSDQEVARRGCVICGYGGCVVQALQRCCETPTTTTNHTVCASVCNPPALATIVSFMPMLPPAAVAFVPVVLELQVTPVFTATRATSQQATHHGEYTPDTRAPHEQSTLSDTARMHSGAEPGGHTSTLAGWILPLAALVSVAHDACVDRC